MNLKAIVEIDNPHQTSGNKLENLDPRDSAIASKEANEGRAEKGLPGYPGRKWEESDWQSLEKTNSHMAMVNPIEIWGGLAFARSRKPHQEQAAAWFKRSYEARYGLGIPASGTGDVPVDFTPVAWDAGMAHKLDRTSELQDIMRKLGKRRSELLVAHIVLGIPASEIGKSQGARERERVRTKIFLALDKLAKLLGFRVTGNRLSA